MSAFRRRLLMTCTKSQKQFADRIIPGVRINHPEKIPASGSYSGQNVAEFLIEPNKSYRITRVAEATEKVFRKGESSVAYADVELTLNNYWNISRGLLEYEFTTVSDSHYLYVWSESTTTATSIWIEKI